MCGTAAMLSIRTRHRGMHISRRRRVASPICWHRELAGARRRGGGSERATGVQFSGALEVGYRACLWSRVASRILLQLFELDARTADEFYERAVQLPWEEHVDPDGTLACEFTGQHAAISNTHFGALRLKDAACDRLRSLYGRRPDVALLRPSVRLIAHAEGSGSASRWISRGRDCIGAVTGRTRASRHCVRIWPPAFCCGPAGPRQRRGERSIWTRCAARVPW